MAAAIPGSGIFSSQQKAAVFSQLYSGCSPGKDSTSKPLSQPGETEFSTSNPDRAGQLGEESIMSTAKLLADDYISYKTKSCATKPLCTHAETLRRVGDEIDEKYSITLKGITERLQFSPEKDGYEGYRACLDSMFDEGQVNWGRIATVYVFSARLAKHCQDRDLIEYVDVVKEYTAQYVRAKLSKWIQAQGGWDAMNDAFKEKDWREKVAFNSLVVTGAVLTGLAALRLLMGK
ncbi:apoptosis regulator BAX-like [Ptychodera flava]|uniref:apoptosis regulator BAX-like n=1 Tax=Ptychodera flava TaxID=63121 RepID=UPI003969BE26